VKEGVLRKSTSKGGPVEVTEKIRRAVACVKRCNGQGISPAPRKGSVVPGEVNPEGGDADTPRLRQSVNGDSRSDQPVVSNRSLAQTTLSDGMDGKQSRRLEEGGMRKRWSGRYTSVERQTSAHVGAVDTRRWNDRHRHTEGEMSERTKMKGRLKPQN
jgi:hypothetical protein